MNDEYITPRLEHPMARPSTEAPMAAIVTDNLDLNLKSFLRHLDAEGKNKGTLTSYRHAVTQLAEFLRATGRPTAVAHITRDDIESFMIHLRDERKQGPATIGTRHRGLQQFWKYLIAEGEVKESPLRNLKAPPIPDNPPAVITDDQMNALFKTCDGASFADRRDTAVLMLLADTGIRRAECAGIMLDDINPDEKTVTVTGKFNRTRTTVYGRETTRALDRYLRRREEHPDHDLPYLWLGKNGRLTMYGIEQVIERRSKDADLDGIHPHLFRHTATHNMLADDMSELDVKNLLGWRTTQMLDRYGRSAAAARARAHYAPHSPMDRLRRKS